jgi:hypothetical protein
MPCPLFIYCLTTEASPIDGLQASPRKPCVENGGRETDSPSIPSSHKNRKHVVEKEDRDALEPTTTPTPPIQQANIF